MISPVAISLALYLMEVRRARHRGADDRGRWGKGALALFAAVILIVALFFCLSRGGILSTLVSGCILFIIDRKSTRLNSSHSQISYAVFCLKKKKRTRA